MKKSIIFLAFLLVGSFLQTTGGYAACPINSLDACKADISRGMNSSLKDRVLPNNLDKTVRPNSTIEMREQSLQPQTPSIINTESRPQSSQQGYDANCQFGNCLNKTPESEVNR